MISKMMVRLAQTLHLSCTDTNTETKQQEVRFHMTHITYKFHRVRPKWFLSQWYVRQKLCTYLASRLALPLKGPKLASTWAFSPCGTIRWSKIISKPMVHLAQTMHLSLHLVVPSGESKTISMCMVHLTQTLDLSCSRLALSPNGPSFHLCLIT
jgi:hypothetical protein